MLFIMKIIFIKNKKVIGTINNENNISIFVNQLQKID